MSPARAPCPSPPASLALAFPGVAVLCPPLPTTFFAPPPLAAPPSRGSLSLPLSLSVVPPPPPPPQPEPAAGGVIATRRLASGGALPAAAASRRRRARGLARSRETGGRAGRHDKPSASKHRSWPAEEREEHTRRRGVRGKRREKRERERDREREREREGGGGRERGEGEW